MLVLLEQERTIRHGSVCVATFRRSWHLEQRSDCRRIRSVGCCPIVNVHRRRSVCSCTGCWLYRLISAVRTAGTVLVSSPCWGRWPQVLCKSVDRSVTVQLTVSVCRSLLVPSACRPASRAYRGQVAS